MARITAYRSQSHVGYVTKISADKWHASLYSTKPYTMLWVKEYPTKTTAIAAAAFRVGWESSLHAAQQIQDDADQ